MNVTLEEFEKKGGWYLRIDGRSVCVLLPRDIANIAERYGSADSKEEARIKVATYYATQVNR